MDVTPPRIAVRDLSVAVAVGLWLAASSVGCGLPAEDDVRRAIEAGRPREAWRLAQDAVRADSASAGAWTDVARAALATWRTAPGLEAADRARRLAPDDPEPLLLRAYLDQRRLRNVAAVAAADSARSLAPDDLRVVRAAGELRLGGGMIGCPDHHGAEEAFRAVLALDSTDVRARFGLGMILVLDGRGAEGAPLLDGVLAQWPAWGEAHYLRGLARMRARDFEGALASFDAAVAYDPSDAAASFNRARILDRLGRGEEAAAARERSEIVRDLVERVRLDAEKWHASGDAQHGVSYARTMRHAGQWEDARELARALVEEFPRQAATHLELAEAAWALCDAREARESAETAAQLAPGTARAWVLAACAAEAAGDAEDAHRFARAAVERDPSEPEAVALLAHLLVTAGRADEAFGPLDEAVRRGARDIRVAGSRSEAMVALGQAPEAEALLSRMIRTQRKARWFELRAEARRQAGWSDAAIDDLRTAIEMEPGRTECRHALIDLLGATGRTEEADALRRDAERLREETAGADAAMTRWRDAPRDPAAAAAAVEKLVAAGRRADAGWVTRRTVGFGERP